MNAANEAAVAAYLQDKIRFYDIPEVISAVMATTSFVQQPSVEDVFATHEEAYTQAQRRIAAL